MIRKSLTILFMLIFVTCAHGQKKTISQAKAYLKAGNNFDKAEQLMQGLLKDSANRTNERIWLLLFESVRKQYEQGNERLYLKQQYDTASLFNLTMKMFRTLEAFDSVDASPDEAGKVKPIYRRRHAEYLNGHRVNLFNGGLFFIGKQNFADAYRFFDTYIKTADLPLFAHFKYRETDRRLPEAAYWAVYCGYKNKDAKSTLHHTYLALKDTAHYSLMLQYLAETYKLENDTVRYRKTLQEGFRKYPLFPFFFSRLVELYTYEEDWEEMLNVANEAIAQDTANIDFRVVRSNALIHLARYDECIQVCNELIAMNDSCADAYYNAGMAYFYQAVEQDKKLQVSAKLRKLIIENYNRSKSYIEKYRTLAPEQKDRWALPLYTIYLNLNMGKEFDEIDAIMRGSKGRKDNR